ncbi:uncharacterized protein LOC134094369 [Sardina pilchardus]|uniref:uncharacterized protein LOC134094369 n=1 Tax=Sardina pilchardus TaxID=27697 RepID=UPI002E0D1FA4
MRGVLGCKGYVEPKASHQFRQNLNKLDLVAISVGSASGQGAPSTSWTAYGAQSPPRRLTTSITLQNVKNKLDLLKLAPGGHIGQFCIWIRVPSASWTVSWQKPPPRRLTISITLQNVNKLDLLKLAPGGHIGRFCIWTGSVFCKLDGLYGTWRKASTQVDYNLAMHKMTNTDLSRILKSDEVHKALCAPQHHIAECEEKAGPAEACSWSPYRSVLHLDKSAFRKLDGLYGKKPPPRRLTNLAMHKMTNRPEQNYEE